jgi:hypothetical protein
MFLSTNFLNMGGDAMKKLDDLKIIDHLKVVDYIEILH